VHKTVWVAASGVNGARYFPNSVSYADALSSTGAVSVTSPDMTAAVAVQWGDNTNAADTASLKARSIVIRFPV
jgi:hypothetical protein